MFFIEKQNDKGQSFECMMMMMCFGIIKQFNVTKECSNWFWFLKLNAGSYTLSWRLGSWSVLSLSSVSLQLKLSMAAACVSYPFLLYTSFIH